MKTKRLTMNEVRSLGHSALLRALGPQGYVDFVRQYHAGSGDFTVERTAAANSLSIDEVIKLAQRDRMSDE